MYWGHSVDLILLAAGRRVGYGAILTSFIKLEKERYWHEAEITVFFVFLIREQDFFLISLIFLWRLRYAQGEI